MKKTISPELSEKLKNTFEFLRAETNRIYNIEVPVIYVKFDLTTQQTLGAIGKHPEYENCFSARLNLDLLARYGQLYIDEVIVHEFAHAVTDLKYPRGVRPHGKEWKAIARNLGLKNPKSTTSLFEVDKKHLRTFPYKCVCKTHQLGIRKHNAAVKQYKTIKRNRYTCSICKTQLQYVENVD